MPTTFSQIDRQIRSGRDKVATRLFRRTGADFVNHVLLTSGRQPISVATYAAWIDDLCGDADILDAYRKVQPRMAAAYPKKFAGTWADRVHRTTAIVDIYYALTRALAPALVIETGVAFGMSSALVLAALAHNGNGRLQSIDLPAAGQMDGHFSGEHVGAFVPDAFRTRWDLILGDARTELPKLFAAQVPDLFSHDSDHTYSQMAFEYALAASWMKPRSVIVSDDTRMSTAFLDVMHGVGASVVPHAQNPSLAAAVMGG